MREVVKKRIILMVFSAIGGFFGGFIYRMLEVVDYIEQSLINLIG